MNKELLIEYGNLKIEEKKIAARISELNGQVLENILQSGADKVETDIGAFSIITRKKWTYSDRYENKKEELNLMKTEEEADGTAEFEETSSLMFKEKKV